MISRRGDCLERFRAARSFAKELSKTFVVRCLELKIQNQQLKILGSL
jgi:hypothetical protein